MTFRRARHNWQRRFWAARAGLALGVVAALIVTVPHLPFINDPFAQVRADAAVAVQALKDGNLAALDETLAANRGQADFAYFFTSKTTPRALGDALATAAGTSRDSPLKSGIETHAYDLALTDLAGAVALATHGTGDRALPASWTDDFIKATTTPETLYGEEKRDSAKVRADQDVANKQNLLLLLSRGYWSTEFLKEVTAAYWKFDHDKGDDAWPGATLEDAKYASAPTGSYLTDGFLALIAALTANSAASKWAFTDFQPGTEKIDGSDYVVGKFTHYLLFEHQFPKSSDGESIGMTAALTALSSAIDATGAATELQAVTVVWAVLDEVGPMHDSIVLRSLAQDLADGSGCSPNPLDYWNCAKAAAGAVWHWIQHWGHRVLDILALTTFAPPPFTAIGLAAAATNATWYAIGGDYAAAGLSLAAAVPGLAFGKIAKGVKAGSSAEKAAANADDVAKTAKEVRGATVVTPEYLRVRPALRKATKEKVLDAAPKTADGGLIDPNTGKIIPRGAKFHYGHKPGYEWRCLKAKALSEGWTEQQLLDYFNDPTHLQIEDPVSNQSHQYEGKVCK